MSETWKPKRFWSDTRVEPVDNGYTIELDGRPVRTPAKAPFVLPTRDLADAIAAEWEAQGEEVQPGTMPFTRTANSAIDKVSVQYDEIAKLLAAYGETDLLCYRAEGPDALVRRQADAWDPLLDWAADTLGARLKPVTGVIPFPQDSAALERLSGLTRNFDPFALAAFHDLVTLTGSLVAGFAVTHQALAPEEIWERSRIDEIWQQEQWGIDEEAANHAALKKRAFLEATHFFSLLGGR